MSRTAISVFCEDLRQELGNKVSLIGIYYGDLYVEFFPILLPKLVVSTTVVSPIEQPFGDVVVRMEVDGAVVREDHFPSDVLARVMETARDDPDATRMSLICNQMLVPMPLEKAGVIRTVVIADGVELKAGRLRVSTAPLDSGR